MTTPSGGLRRIVARGLFGLRNYDIGMDEQRPTVLTGMNGTGKSTLLRLVNAASTGDMRALVNAPLDAFELHFANIPAFKMRRSDAGTARLEWGEHQSTVETSPSIDDLPEWAVSVFQSPHDSEMQRREALAEAASQNAVSVDEYQRAREFLESSDAIFQPSAPEWLAGFQAAFPVIFVTDQRLVVEAARGRSVTGGVRKGIRSPARLAVEAASAEIAEQMRRVDSAYARTSQQQDRKFPRDVITAMSDPEKVPLRDLQTVLGQVDALRDNLRAVGLLDSDQMSEADITPESLEQEQVRPVIATFLRATLVKMAVLEDLAGRLRIFKGFLDGRFAPKTMSITRRTGLSFVLPSGLEIRPRQLSSGEQQMMVLAYEILFRAADGTLVVIDEPEISLHVLWQDTLITDLTEMGRAAKKQFLMATHSPVLLALHPELERSLDQED